MCFEVTIELITSGIFFLQEDAKTLVQIASDINKKAPEGAKQENVDESVLNYMSYTARADLCPMQAVIGGIVAQEVMKVMVMCAVERLLSTFEEMENLGSKQDDYKVWL